MRVDFYCLIYVCVLELTIRLYAPGNIAVLGLTGVDPGLDLLLKHVTVTTVCPPAP